MFNLSALTPPVSLSPLYLSVSPSLLATSFKRADGEFRDVSSAPVPRRSGQLLPPGQDKINLPLTHILSCAVNLLSLCQASLFVTVFLCVSHRRKALPHFMWQPRQGRSCRLSCSWCMVLTLDRLTLTDAHLWTMLGTGIWKHNSVNTKPAFRPCSALELSHLMVNTTQVESFHVCVCVPGRRAI